jgi:hypothetical protein
MFKEVMNVLWLARISSLSNKVGLYVVLLEVLLFMPNSLIRHNSRPKSVFIDQEAVKCLSSLHDKYVIVPAYKASNNIVFVCKSYYFECLIKELGINSNTSSNTLMIPLCTFLCMVSYGV